MRRSDHSPRPIKPAPRPERQAAVRVGISAESRAAAFPIAQAAFWCGAGGESPRRNQYRRAPAQLLVFAEVKARASLDETAGSANERQRRRIATAAEVWLAANPDDKIHDIRFDAILVAPGKIPRPMSLAAFETN